MASLWSSFGPKISRLCSPAVQVVTMVVEKP